MPSQSSPKVFLFGPQALAFDAKLFTILQSHLYGSWAQDSLSDLPNIWESLVQQVPKLQHVEGGRLLRELHQGLQTGHLPDSLFPLPNTLLSPLVVIVHLTQYITFVKSAFPDLADTDELPESVLQTSETLGLCTGILSAFAVSCSSSIAKVQQYGAVAVRLSMLAGALVDAEEASPDTGSRATSFSMSWNTLETHASVSEVLAKFPEAYISVFVDEKRATVTAPREAVPALLDQLKLSGAHVAEVALSGRFHWPKHREDANQLIAFCDRNPEFQFPDESEIVLPTKLGTGGRLHEIALQEILLNPSEWFKLFGIVQSSHIDAGGANFVCFGPERCVPPTMLRKLGHPLIHIPDIDLSTSSLPSALLSPASASPFDHLPDDQIAVIGMACHVPGAEDLDEYWRVLTQGQSQHTEVPLERFSMKTAFRELEKNRKWYGNFIRDYDTFDHKFFKKSAREMSSADPQHRLVLKLAYQAIEQSGYFGSTQHGKHIGCYIGIGNNDYEHNIACHQANAYSATGNLRSFAAGKVSHYFGWTGPSLTIDTACSSSGVAIHQACRAILHGECTSALAGGVNVLTSPEWFQNLAGASFLSPTGQCKPFDARGDGYCRGEGAGVVYLKRLSSAIADGDQVLGVIASTRVYQNQNCTAITVPNSLSLAELFGDVVEQARLEPQAISVVEAHGTGTPVGDPAEYDAIRRVFGGSIRSDALSLMSVKGLLGHTEFASGIVSLIKILLMINEGFIPPQASFTSLSPGLNADHKDMIKIATQLTNWNVDFRAALINNYGASGSNASMIITQAPKPRSLPSNSSQLSTSAIGFPFWFCGIDSQSLRAYVTKFRRFIQDNANSAKELTLRNLSFQLSRQSNRTLPKALIFNSASRAELEEKLLAFEQGSSKSVTEIEVPPSRPVILCFGGQISTYVGLGKDVYNQVAILRTHLDQCNEICLSLDLGSIYPGIFQRSPILDTVELQTVLFAAQYSCAKAWIDCGVKVTAVVGHSFGELTALCIAGAYSLTDALRLISGRARLIRDKWGHNKGSMMAVEADLADVTALLSTSNKPDVSIACYNGPRSFTLAGSTESIQFIEGLAGGNQIFSGMKVKKLNVTNAFHSSCVDSFISDLEALGHEIQFKEPTIHVEAATDSRSSPVRGSNFIAQHLRNPVYFNHAVQRLAKEYPAAIWLEAGSNSTITTMVSRALGNSNSPHHFQSVHVTSEESLPLLAEATIKLWKEGLNVSFWAHHSMEVSNYTPVILPPYQFEKARHWLELKEIPEVEATINAPVEAPEPPKGLTTFLGYEDQAKQSARFRVNTTCEKFQQLTSGNVVLNTAVTPGMLQIEIPLDAMMNLQPDFKKYQFQPEVQGISYHNALTEYNSSDLYLDAVAKDDRGLVWKWRLYATDSAGSVTDFSSGTILFQPASDPALKENFEHLSRLSGKKRCASLLQGKGADDILQGRNIYRAFEQVVSYAEQFRCVTKILGNLKEDESAGYVSKTYAGEAWIDSILTECYCQVAGIFINLMTDESDLSERGVYICDGISRWIQNSRQGGMASAPGSWEVFAVHHRESETKYVSDVFAFDARDGTLSEAILGISYRIVPMKSMLKLLTRSTQQESHLTTVVSSSSTSVNAPTPATTASPTPSILESFQDKNIVKKSAKPPGPDVSAKTCEIICNLSGLEPEEIKDDSDLVELGIDSLMAMELVREVYAAFKCTLQNEQLMELTDFASLVSCIRTTLGFEDEESGASLGGNSSVETNGHNTVLEANAPNTNIISDSVTDGSATMSSSTILDAFREIKWDTDNSIVKGQMGTYSKHVMPRSTELCIVYIVDAFEQLGCPIRSTAPGQVLKAIPYHPKHKKFMHMIIYGLLEKHGRLIDINGSTITRTAVAAPTSSAETLLSKLLQDEPVHAAEHRLTALVGRKFADLITDKEDGLKLIFGTPESREIAADMYSNSPVNKVWIQQLEQFLEQVLSRLPKDGEPVCILEVGGGTGGTTSRLVPLLAKLGVPVKYIMSDISGSLIAAARKRFKQYPFMEFKALNMETEPDAKLLQSQHIILATNCIHATRNLSISLKNLHRILRPDGALIMLEMTEQVPWCDFIFGLLEGWWLFEDGRDYVLQPPTYWEKVLQSVGYGHVDWTEGDLPESRIQRLIIAHASGSRYDRGPKPPLATTSELTLPDTSERGAAIDAIVQKYTKDFVAPSYTSSSTKLPSLGSGHCVLVTGATGSLGAHIVASLAQRPDIHKVVCLNRLSATEATVRQQESLQMRGISLDPTSLSKLKVIETDTSKPNLGLSPDNYQYLIQNVTEIVHSAWPMSLTRPLKAYESQFKIARGLIDLACQVSQHRPAPFKFGFQFVSSSAVIANYPLWKGTPLVPEEPGTVESVPLTGYAEAKLATERILATTLYRLPERFHVMAVRIAQITGSTSNGYWNPSEYMPFLIKSSQVLKVLPDLDGTLSWCPVNDVAAALGELLLSESATDLIYHIDNPSRQTWQEMISILARALGLGQESIVPFSQWVDRVRGFRGSTTDNPALQLIDFFDYYFVPMSCGGLILDTTKSLQYSKTLRDQGPINEDLMMKYIARWKESGFLNG